MVVVDSSALIPLAWVGRLDLIRTVFDEIKTTELIQEEVLTKGERGTATLRSFFNDVRVVPTPSRADAIASLDGITVADASTIVLAENEDAILLANDKGLIEVARSHNVECWWITTLLLKSTKRGITTPTEANDILYDLVDEGMNLHPKVYTQIQQRLNELD